MSNRKIPLIVMYPTHLEQHKDQIEFKVTPEKAIDLIKNRYKGWMIVIKTPSGKLSTTDLDEIRGAEAVYLFYPVGGG